MPTVANLGRKERHRTLAPCDISLRLRVPEDFGRAHWRLRMQERAAWRYSI